jgi:hypothetical protein
MEAPWVWSEDAALAVWSYRKCEWPRTPSARHLSSFLGGAEPLGPELVCQNAGTPSSSLHAWRQSLLSDDQPREGERTLAYREA